MKVAEFIAGIAESEEITIDVLESLFEQMESTLDDLEKAIVLYRKALDVSRDCCGCGEGIIEQCAADLLTGHKDGWPDRTINDAHRLLDAS